MVIDVKIEGIPNNLLSKKEKISIFKSRIIYALDKILPEEMVINNDNVNIKFSDKQNKFSPKSIGVNENLDHEFNFEKRAKQYNYQKPTWTFEQIVLSQNVLSELDIALSVLKNEYKVFDEWGLRSLEPFPRSALNFYGPPGTGKTMAAHAIANYLGKNILVASYAQIESKYHGEGPKNIEALFLAANKDDAILFIDEADSLLSTRLLNVTQGSEQAINSMRSQLLISLEKFRGIVIFATNLISNYDNAFETRVRNIYFPFPDLETRKKIWEIHLLSSIPKEYDINFFELAELFPDFCGRDIKNAVINACLSLAGSSNQKLSQRDLIDVSNKIVESKESLKNNSNPQLSSDEKKTIAKGIKKQIIK